MVQYDDSPSETSRLLPNHSIGKNNAEPQVQESAFDWIVLIAVSFTWLASFLAALDSTITSTLSVTIASEFGSVTLISWLGAAYLMALAAVQPISGKLTDIFGRKPGFLISVTFFCLGNALCGIAHSENVVIIGRVLAGIGGGGINSITTYISSDLIPLRRRGMWHGVGSIIYGTGLGLGGVIGGMINETWGWRWAFFIILPLAVTSGIGVAIFLPDFIPAEGDQSVRAGLRRVDFGGSITLIAGLLIFQYGLNAESSNGISSSLLLGVTMPSAGILLASFILIEIYFAREPILPITLLRLRTVSGASLTGFFTSMAMYSFMFYVPLYIQLRGYGTSQTGLLLLVQPIGGAIGSFSSGLIMRLTGKYGFLKILVLIVYVTGAAGFSTVTVDTPIFLPEIYLFLEGFGFGGMLTIMLLALLSAVKNEDQATVTAILYVFRTTGATLGVSLASMVFRKVLASNLHDIQPVNLTLLSSSHHNPPAPSVESYEQTLRHCSQRHSDSISNGLCPPPVIGAYMAALHATFCLTLGFAIAGFLSGLITKNNHLSEKRKARIGGGEAKSGAWRGNERG